VLTLITRLKLLTLASAGEKATPSQHLMSRENFYFVYSTFLLIDLTLKIPTLIGITASGVSFLLDAYSNACCWGMTCGRQDFTL
jgi:hypothetical protein